MGIAYGTKWTILPDTLRFFPNYTTNILIHVESSGLNDSVQNRTQYVRINGDIVLLNATSPRSYRITRLRYVNGWTYHSSNGYDVYGDVVQANNLLAYLQTFNTGDIMILNTFDEPNQNKNVFADELKNSFFAQLQDSAVWAFRCSYQLIAVKGKGVIYENIKEPGSSNGIETSLWLG